MSRSSRVRTLILSDKEMTAKSQIDAPSPIFTIDVEQLEKAPCKMDREIPLAWLAQEMTSCEYPARPLTARLILEAVRHDAGVLVKGFAIVEVEAECGLCLAGVTLNLKCSVSSFLMSREAADEANDDDELTPEELEREWFEGETVVLDDLIRDAVMLELPMDPRCPDACESSLSVEPTPEGPTEKPIDPRLAPLASIKLSKE